MKVEKISELTTNRLSVYLRCLNVLASNGIKTVSSQALADQFNLNSAQIRKDLGCFGEFGVRGVGYFVDELRQHITGILGLDYAHRVGIIGAGNLGSALANYNGFTTSNFAVVAVFDTDPQKIGKRIGHANLPVHDIKSIGEIVSKLEIDVVVIAVPARFAQRVLNQVTAVGIRAVLNFAPVRLHTRPEVKVKNVDLSIALESLSYFLGRSNSKIVANPPNNIQLSNSGKQNE
jgi:redox-sensing transcriptional repressor